MNQKNCDISLLQATIEASLDAVLITDTENRNLLKYNQNLLKLWSLPLEINPAPTLQNLIHQISQQLKDPKTFLDIFQNRAKGRENERQIHLELKNGSTFELHSKVLFSDKETFGHIWFFRETQPRSQSLLATDDQRRQLPKHWSFLEEILSSLPSLISYVGRDYEYLYLNATYEKWWGISRDQYLGKHIAELVGNKPFEFYKPYLDAAFKGQTISYEADVEYAKAGKKSTYINYIPHKSETGHVEGTFVIVHDISELKKSQNELVLKEQFLNQIVENIPTALFITDANDDFKFTLWNKAAEDIFGVPREKIIGKTASDVWPQKSARYYREIDHKVAQEKKTFHSYEIVSQKNEAHGTYLQVIKAPIHSSDTSKVESVLTACTDITKEREAHRILLQTAKMSSLGEMASGIAHEINNPLTIISLNAIYLKDKINKECPQQQELLNAVTKIEKTCERISKIIRSLRAFSRNSEADPMQIVDFKQILEDTLELCKERFRQQGIEIQTDLDDDIRLECRSPQISQIIMNLLSNAHDAIHALPEKWIQIHAIRDDETVKVTITDSGAGIPLPLQEKIMQPFFTTKEVGKGTGLGLSISKGIAEEHHGRLYYDPKDSHTRFVLELPLRQGHQSSKPMDRLTPWAR